MHHTSTIARATAILLLGFILSACPSVVQRAPRSHAGTGAQPSDQGQKAGETGAAGETSAAGEAADAEPTEIAGKADQTGRAAWYGDRYHGRKTASGERFDQDAFTAAHRTLPFGTVVQVKNLDNDRTVNVRINDRGPFGRKTRIIDVSRAAARVLDMERSGVVPVELRIVRQPAASGSAQAR
jgi:rare lipoprotein A